MKEEHPRHWVEEALNIRIATIHSVVEMARLEWVHETLVPVAMDFRAPWPRLES